MLYLIALMHNATPYIECMPIIYVTDVFQLVLFQARAVTVYSYGPAGPGCIEMAFV